MNISKKAKEKIVYYPYLLPEQVILMIEQLSKLTLALIVINISIMVSRMN
ncbi:MAG: hypothetical protein mread185_000448 [Mycoplasmataceae bacterium]|nr:MAG: hypothetical protein mread185_000448 [Mycoplasmataceae bacterium]